jgi:hypothetical protein
MNLPTIGHNSKSPRANFYRAKDMWLIEIMGRRDLTAITKTIAVAISLHLNSNSWQAWPSRKRLAEMCSVSVRTVERAVKELERTGFLRVSRKSNCANRYEMRKSNGEVVQEDTSWDVGGDSPDARGATTVSPGGVQRDEGGRPA